MSRTTPNPEIPGWYITFQTALLQQAPRPGNELGQIDQATANDWVKNQGELKEFMGRMTSPQNNILTLIPKESNNPKRREELMEKMSFECQIPVGEIKTVMSFAGSFPIEKSLERAKENLRNAKKYGERRDIAIRQLIHIYGIQ